MKLWSLWVYNWPILFQDRADTQTCSFNMPLSMPFHEKLHGEDFCLSRDLIEEVKSLLIWDTYNADSGRVGGSTALIKKLPRLNIMSISHSTFVITQIRECIIQADEKYLTASLILLKMCWKDDLQVRKIYIVMSLPGFFAAGGIVLSDLKKSSWHVYCWNWLQTGQLGQKVVVSPATACNNSIHNEKFSFGDQYLAIFFKL